MSDFTDALRAAADALEAQPPKTKASYVAALRLYAAEPWRLGPQVMALEPLRGKPAKHHCEEWQLLPHPDGGLYCSVCGRHEGAWK